VEKSDIKLSALQFAIEIRAEVNIQFQLRRRMQARKPRQQCGQMSHRETIRDTHTKRADQSVLRADVRGEAFPQSHDLLGVANYLGPAAGNSRPREGTIHDLRPRLPLQLANTTGDRGLGNVEVPGRRPKATEPCDPDQGFELIQAHAHDNRHLSAYSHYTGFELRALLSPVASCNVTHYRKAQ